MGENVGNVHTPVGTCARRGFCGAHQMDQGAARTMQPPASCPPACPAVPEGQESSPAWIPTKEPQFVGVFLRFGSRQREERAHKVVATRRDVGVTSPQGHCDTSGH